MRVRLSEPSLVPDLMAHFRARGYLVAQDGAVVSVVPLNVLSERADRQRSERVLREWQEQHAGVLAVVEGDRL